MLEARTRVPRWPSLNARQRTYWRIGRLAGRVHGHGPLMVAMGDSLTDPSSGSTLPWQVWLRRVGRTGYKTVNLGVSGDTTADMRHRVGQMLSEGRPDIAVLFGGSNDAFRGIDTAETDDNATFIIEWLRDHGVHKIVVIGPGLLNWNQEANAWAGLLDEVRDALARVAERCDVIFVDLAEALRARIERGDDPDFARAPYRQADSWHVKDGDPHFNAYGQRLVAEAFLRATADWRRPARGGAG